MAAPDLRAGVALGSAMQDFLNTPIGSAPVAIYEDGGGLVTAYQRKALQYTLEGRQVEIHGSCRSACVLALSVPDVCVDPGAVVKAHHAYETYTKRIRADVTQEILGALPQNIQNVLSANIQTSYNEGSTLTYEELKGLGVADCQHHKPRVAKVKHPQEIALSQILGSPSDASRHDSRQVKKSENIKALQHLMPPTKEILDPMLVISAALAVFIYWKLCSVLGVRVDRIDPTGNQLSS